MSAHNKNNPVQIVLSANNYVTTQEKHGGGSTKEFFPGRDVDFVQHKSNLTTQLKSISESIERSASCQSTFVKVKLRKEAWAKSHRPTRKLFSPERAPTAGVDGIGELYFRVSTASIPSLIRSIHEAEDKVSYKFNEEKNVNEPSPSRIRSEVGAIQEIDLPQASDRRSFSVKQGVLWLDDKRSGRMYLIDLFQLPKRELKFLSSDKDLRSLYESLIKELENLDFGVLLFRSSIEVPSEHGYVIVRPIKRKVPLSLLNFLTPWDQRLAREEYSDSEDHHDQLLKILSKHPLVRRIVLPPILQSAQGPQRVGGINAVIPPKVAGVTYPKVGIIDAGVGLPFSNWVIDRSKVIDPHHRSDGHGSFIAGLLTAARSIGNSELVAKEPDGCELIDIDIFPDSMIAGAFASYYPNGFEDFLQEMDLAIKSAKQRHGVRVFNLSLNVQQEVQENVYGPLAELMDAIAEKHDVVIVVSAGNLDGTKFRGAWPKSPDRVAAYLLPHAGTDRIYQPSESVLALTVGAVNTPGSNDHAEGAPTPYTRRGPGMKIGVKPDFGHYGGTPRSGSSEDGSLYSVDGAGSVTTGMGTSYSAPLVAKTLATIMSSIDGYVTRENLVALMVHGASVPKVLDTPELRTISRQFVGFGIPSGSQDVLLNDDNSITMVFNSTLTTGKYLCFDFAWPKSLVSQGKCRGAVNLTLVYKPVIDGSFGAEFLRVNLDGYLRQQTREGNYKGRTKQLFMKQSKDDAHYESDLIEHGLKWWPIKRYVMNAPKGLAGTSDWQLIVEPLLRDGAQFPATGIPFCAIMTIFDPKGSEPVFNDMKLWLSSNNVRCDDIRTGLRVRTRG